MQYSKIRIKYSIELFENLSCSSILALFKHKLSKPLWEICSCRLICTTVSRQLIQSTDIDLPYSCLQVTRSIVKVTIPHYNLDVLVQLEKIGNYSSGINTALQYHSLYIGDVVFRVMLQ